MPAPEYMPIAVLVGSPWPSLRNSRLCTLSKIFGQVPALRVSMVIIWLWCDSSLVHNHIDAKKAAAVRSCVPEDELRVGTL